MKDKALIPANEIKKHIFFIRDEKVMLDRDLAELYGVETRVLNQAVKRNKDRFPEDFIFRLNDEEFKNWKSQIVMSKSDKMGLRRNPYVFTEQGIAMLSSVLNSKRAIAVNIQIMRAFVNMRKFALTNKELARKIQQLEKKYDKQFRVVFEAIKQLIQEPETGKKKIGF